MGRLRSIKDIDLSTANKNCPKCKGTGVNGQREVEIGGDIQVVPVICSCVCDAGGVRPDALAKHYNKMQADIEAGTFIPKTIETIMAMDERARMMAIEAYERLLARPAMDQEAKRVISQILEKIYKRIRKEGGGSAVH